MEEPTPEKDHQCLFTPKDADAPTEISVLRKRDWHRYPSGLCPPAFAATSPSGHKDVLTLRRTLRKIEVRAAARSSIYRKELTKLLMKQQAFRKYT